MDLEFIDGIGRGRSEPMLPAESMFRILVDSIEDYAVFLIDTGGRVASWNSGAERIKGYRAEEILGRHFSIFHGPEDIAQGEPERELREAAAWGHSEYQGLRVRKDGSTYWADVVITAVRGADGELRGFADVTRDISDRRKAELERAELLRREQEALEEVRAERAQLESALFSAVNAFALYTRDELQFFNPALIELFGGPPGELGDLTGSLCTPDGEPLSAQNTPFQRALRGEVVRGEEFLLVRPHATSTPVLVNASPVPRDSPQPRAAVITFQDIRVRKELDQLREEYLGLITHDLRNPLATVRLQAQAFSRALARHGLIEELNAKGNGPARILESLGRIDAMVSELLETTRLEGGTLELKRELVELGPLVHRSIESILIPEQRARVQARIEGQPLAHVDRGRVERVLENLLSNAIKYSAPGTPVLVSAANEGEEAVRLCVTNEGPQLEPSELARIFQKYYRFKARRQTDGTGLGLYISSLIVRAHGGKIWADSEPGRTTFTFLLPRALPR